MSSSALESPYCLGNSILDLFVLLAGYNLWLGFDIISNFYFGVADFAPGMCSLPLFFKMDYAVLMSLSRFSLCIFFWGALACDFNICLFMRVSIWVNEHLLLCYL